MHKKHIKLEKRINDNLAPNEFSILGAKCSVISDLVISISEELKSKYKISYIDASHSDTVIKPAFDVFTFHKSGNLQIEKESDLNKFNERIRFNGYDVSFINGNHYKGNKQIVILDAEKESSIKKRIDEITDIKLLIKKDENSFVFDCLKDKFLDINNIPILNISEIEKISSEIKKHLVIKCPKLKGLVLVGGESSRMGKDKSKLEYFGKEHSLFLFDLLKDKKIQTFLSVKEPQLNDLAQIEDRFLNMGPFGALCSAFLKYPNNAFLVLATDLPYIDNDLIDLLLENRDPRKIATAVKGYSKEFPEPLITIWEPKSYPVLLNYLAQGYSCPRKVLINSDVKIIEIDDKLITNVNTPEEFKAVKKSLK